MNMLRLGELVFWLIVGSAIIAALELFVVIYMRMANDSERVVLRVFYRRLRIAAYSAVLLDGIAVVAFPRSVAWMALIIMGMVATVSAGIPPLMMKLRR
jgi:hypothetical protein